LGLFFSSGHYTEIPYETAFQILITKSDIIVLCETMMKILVSYEAVMKTITNPEVII
jgi:hypothetical protein